MGSKPRFLDKEEELEVKQIIETLGPSHPLRIAFNEGADTMTLLFQATDSDIKVRLRATRVEALNRDLARD
jgi:hypothetical protein